MRNPSNRDAPRTVTATVEAPGRPRSARPPSAPPAAAAPAAAPAPVSVREVPAAPARSTSQRSPLVDARLGAPSLPARVDPRRQQQEEYSPDAPSYSHVSAAVEADMKDVDVEDVWYGGNAFVPLTHVSRGVYRGGG